MATENENQAHHENAETRRQERREEANADYREQGDDMRQGGPDPDLPHRMRSRPGDGSFDPNVQAEDGTSDGVAAHMGSSGQGASQRGGDTIIATLAPTADATAGPPDAQGSPSGPQGGDLGTHPVDPYAAHERPRLQQPSVSDPRTNAAHPVDGVAATLDDAASLALVSPEAAVDLLVESRRIAVAEGHDSYRLVFNTGELAGQTVFHVHAHVLAGALREGSLA